MGGDPAVRKTLGLDRRGRGRSRFVRRLLPIALIVAAIALLVMWRRSRAAANKPAFKMAEVTRGDLQVTITATGSVKGLSTVEVGAEISGKISKLTVDYNDPVKKGQVLAEIDPEQLEAALDEAKARVAVANADIAVASATALESRKKAERAAQQVIDGLLSKQDLETAQATQYRAAASLTAASASAEVARASLKNAQSKLDKAIIVSPIDGVVLARLVEPGQTVTAGLQTPVLFKLAGDLTKMALHVDVDEADVGRVRDGLEATFTVDAYQDRTFPSKVISLRNEPKISQNVVTYEAVLSVDNSERLLKPGMTATATIISEKRIDVLLVPNAALRFTPPPVQKGGGGLRFGPGPTQPPPDEGIKGPKVWVLDGETPHAILLKIGPTDTSSTQVIEGDIEPGTHVIVDVLDPEPN